MHSGKQIGAHKENSLSQDRIPGEKRLLGASY